METNLGRLTVTAAAWALLLAPLVASAQEASFDVSLSGSEVSGDPDGSGEGTVTLDPETGEITARITYSNIAEPTSIHLRQGALGTQGNIVGTFLIESARGGTLEARGTVRSSTTVEQILASPEDFYLVVFNDEHVVGALRGPLRN